MVVSDWKGLGEIVWGARAGVGLCVGVRIFEDWDGGVCGCLGALLVCTSRWDGRQWWAGDERDLMGSVREVGMVCVRV